MLAIFGRYIFPWLLRLLFNSAAERMSTQFQNMPPRESKQKEGEVTIRREHTQSTGSNSNSKYDDEYVDFEEIP